MIISIYKNRSYGIVISFECLTQIFRIITSLHNRIIDHRRFIKTDPCNHIRIDLSECIEIHGKSASILIVRPVLLFPLIFRNRKLYQIIILTFPFVISVKDFIQLKGRKCKHTDCNNQNDRTDDSTFFLAPVTPGMLSIPTMSFPSHNFLLCFLYMMFPDCSIAMQSQKSYFLPYFHDISSITYFLEFFNREFIDFCVCRRTM